MLATRLVPLLLVALPLSACGEDRPVRDQGAADARPAADCPSSRTDGFAVSLVSETGGAASPQAAAEAFVRTGSVWSGPTTGWTVTEQDGTTATVSADGSHLHVLQGPDASWQVDSGYRCG